MNKNYLEDENLSLKAKGLLTIMLKVPFKTMQDLSLMSKDGYTATKTAMSELEENSYVEILKTNKNGRFYYKYSAFEYSLLSERVKQSKNIKKPPISNGIVHRSVF